MGQRAGSVHTSSEYAAVCQPELSQPLRKIEELTLYLIEQDAMIKQLKAERRSKKK